MNLYSCMIQDRDRPQAPVKEIEIKGLNLDYARIAVDVNYPDYRLISVKYLRPALQNGEIHSNSPTK